MRPTALFETVWFWFNVTVSMLLTRTVLRDPARGGVASPRHADAGPPGPS